MNVEIGAEAALFPEKEYINGIAVAVWVGVFVSRLYEILEKKNLSTSCLSATLDFNSRHSFERI
jgi:hypothetical protein